MLLPPSRTKILRNISSSRAFREQPFLVSITTWVVVIIISLWIDLRCHRPRAFLRPPSVNTPDVPRPSAASPRARIIDPIPSRCTPRPPWTADRLSIPTNIKIPNFRRCFPDRALAVSRSLGRRRRPIASLNSSCEHMQTALAIASVHSPGRKLSLQCVLRPASALVLL